jgi:hypothetical protein
MSPRVPLSPACRPAALLAVLVYLAMAFVAAPAARAQTGTVAGRVVEAATAETLPGATVVVGALGRGTTTNVEGAYALGLPAGTYDLTVSFIGFAPKTVMGVRVESGRTTTLDVALESATAELDEVVVTAEHEQGSTAAVLNERRIAPAVIDVLDARDISTAGGTAAAAIERSAGAEVTDGRYVSVRGFGGRYGKVTINGVAVPSISPDDRSVPLDVVSSDVLASVTVSKGWTPDLPADFVGGLVDLRTLRAPAGPRLSLSVETSVNSASTFQEGLVIGGCSDAWTGFSNCYRWPESVAGLPDSVGVTGEVVYGGPRSEAHYEAVLTDPEDVRRVARDILAMMPIGPSVQTLQPGRDVELVAGNRYTVGRRPLGVIGVASYASQNQQYADYVFNSPSLDPVFGHVLQTEQSVRVGSLLGLSYEPSPTDRVSATLLYNRLTDDLAQYQAGLYDPNGEQQTARTITTQRVASSLLSAQLAGEHQLFGHAELAWTAAFSGTRRLEPGTMTVQYQGPQAAGLAPDGDPSTFLLPDSLVLSTDLNRKGIEPMRAHFDQRDAAWLGRLDLTLPFRAAGRRAAVKVGGYADLNARVQEGHRVVFGVVADPATGFDTQLPDLVFAPEHVVGDFNPLVSDPTEPGVYIDEATQVGDNFDAHIDVAAGYALLDADVLPGVRVVAGLRVERSAQRVELIPKHNGAALRESALPPGRSYTVDRRFTDVLPGVSVQLALAPTADLRAGYGRTLARPQFRELVEFQYQPRPGAPALQGNPDLERTVVDNLDLRASWYPVPTALVSVGGFFKRFDGPIEPRAGTGGAYINTGRANTFGVETELRLPLALVAERLASFGLGANLALLATRAGSFYALNLVDGNEAATSTTRIPAGSRALFGQTPVLFNAGLTYDPAPLGLSATLLFRYAGEQLRYLDTAGLRTFREPQTTLDVVLSQALGHRLRLDVEARNLIGSRVRYVTERVRSETTVVNGVVTAAPLPPTLATQEAYDRGRTVEVGVAWTF